MNQHYRIEADDMLRFLTRRGWSKGRASPPVVAARRKIDLMEKFAKPELPSSTAETSALPSSDQP